MLDHKLPLAERMRPHNLRDLVGQEHLTNENGVLKKALDSGNIPSMILWGPPGVGKTTLANIIAATLKRPFYSLPAISSGVKEVREVIEKAKRQNGTILFIDEIHRFNKGQQDALLGAVEKGYITLIGATTENPSFEVNAALLSRCQVYTLKSLEKDHLEQLLNHVLTHDDGLKKKQIKMKETGALFRLSGGDARKLYNLLEIVASVNTSGPLEITDKLVEEQAQQKMPIYDKAGEQHYDIISAFIKSIRGSDPNAAVYWLTRMVAGGEDPKFIARRLVILASEDIGNANPTALVLATSTFQAVHMIGYPEASIILSHCTTYLAASPKSNASYLALQQAKRVIKETGDQPVPLAIRNAPNSLMRDIGYGQGYRYAHDYPANFSAMEFLPDQLVGTKFYDPGNNNRENEIRKWLKSRWKDKYGY